MSLLDQSGVTGRGLNPYNVHASLVPSRFVSKQRGRKDLEIDDYLVLTSRIIFEKEVQSALIGKIFPVNGLFRSKFYETAVMLFLSVFR